MKTGVVTYECCPCCDIPGGTLSCYNNEDMHLHKCSVGHNEGEQ